MKTLPDPREFMTRRTLKVKTTRGVEEWDALVLGDLAVMEERYTGGSLYVILHAPTGLSLGSIGCAFNEEIDAARCMEELSKIRNSWSGLNYQDFTPLAPHIARIAQEFNGFQLRKPDTMYEKPTGTEELNKVEEI